MAAAVPEAKIRLVVVDDNVRFRTRMRQLLTLHEDLEVIGEATDGAEAIERARELRPHVVLMDFRMFGMDGFTAGRTIVSENPTVRVFMLTAYPGALDADKIAKGGLAGLLVKDQPIGEIVEAIRKAMRAEGPVAP